MRGRKGRPGSRVELNDDGDAPVAHVAANEGEENDQLHEDMNCPPCTPWVLSHVCVQPKERKQRSQSCPG